MMRNLILCLILVVSFNARAQDVIKRSFLINNKTVFNPKTVKVEKDFIVASKLPNHNPGINNLKRNITTTVNRRTENTKLNINPKYKLKDSAGFVGAVSKSGTPNDNHMAISNGGKVVNVLNSFVRIYDEDGSFTKAFRLSSFAARSSNPKPGGSLPVLDRTYDPRVKYDPITDRFMVVFMQGSKFATSWVIVAFSTTNDPMDAWNVYALKGNNYGDDTWSDYPIIAMTKEDLFITVNQLVNDEDWRTGFRHSVVWQLNKKDGYNGKTLRTNNFSNIKHQGTLVRSVCPVQSYNPIENSKMYLLSAKPMSLNNDTLFIHTISNSVASGKAAFTTKLISYGNKYGLPPNAHQPKKGFKLQTNDARIMDAAYRDGEITYVQNTINFPSKKASIGFGVLSNLDKTPTQRLYIIHSDSMEFGYPSLAYINSNEFDKRQIISFSHSSTTLYPGTSAVFFNGNDVFSEIFILKRGEGVINVPFLADTIERWGDYTSVQPRYNNENEVWLVGSFGSSDSAYASTWIAKLVLNENFVGVSPIKSNKTIGLAYPNPAQEDIVVKVVKGEGDQFQVVQFIDMAGKVALKKSIENMPIGASDIHLNVSNLKGTYLVQIIKRDGVVNLGNTIIH